MKLSIKKATFKTPPPFNEPLLVMERDVLATHMMAPESDKGMRYRYFFGKMTSITEGHFQFTDSSGERQTTDQKRTWYSRIDTMGIEEILDQWVEPIQKGNPDEED